MMMTLLVLLLACGLTMFLSALHYALRDFSLRKLEDLAGRNGGMGRLESIVNEPEGHAVALGAFRTLANIVLIICTFLLLRPFHVAPDEAGVFTWRLDWIRAPIAGISAWALLFLFSFLIPSSIAAHVGEKLIHASAWFVRGSYVVLAPLRVLGVIDIAIKRLAGEAHVTEKEEIEDQLLSVVTEGEREGNLDITERKMIEAIVEFRSQTVEEIMTPRTEIEGMMLTRDLHAVTNFISECGHSRIPVYEEDLDHIVGILYAKDLLRFVGQQADEFDPRSVLRQALFVPETKPLNELLLELQARKVHIAIVLDEYGGTTGLITIEDLIEEIVGDIQDEYESDEESTPEITVHDAEGFAEIEARAYIDDANEMLDSLGIEIPESEDYDTVGGFVVTALGHIPVEGETFAENGYIVTVLAAEPTRVNRLRIEARLPEESAASSPPAEAAPVTDDAAKEPADG